MSRYITLWNIDVKMSDSCKLMKYNDKLQGTVVTYLSSWILNNQTKQGLLLSQLVKEFLKSVNIWQLRAKRWIVSCTLFEF